jgi:23S rRNA pseudouridine2604 synthase
MPEPKFPMRINKYLALKKYSTRRGADEIIKKKQVFINGRLAVLGDKVQMSDQVQVKLKTKPIELMYFAFNKPKGVAAHGEEEEDGASKKIIKKPGEPFPVGALEKESQGLMILTNDGRITERFSSPAYKHERKYVVTTKNNIRASFQERMEAGVKIENDLAEKCKVEVLDENTFEVIFNNEKKHQLRRMCAALFQEVRSIKCTRIMNIELGKLKENQRREIRGEELQIFLKNLQLL